MENNYMNFIERKRNIIFKFILFFLLIILSCYYAQYYHQLYVALAPWRYFSDANELLVLTLTTAVIASQQCLLNNTDDTYLELILPYIVQDTNYTMIALKQVHANTCRTAKISDKAKKY